MDILQMLGRAGRPQFDKIGVGPLLCRLLRSRFLELMMQVSSLALIMTDKESQQHYENLVNAQVSSLLPCVLKLALADGSSPRQRNLESWSVS